jgi:hypothetical protein
MSTQDLGMNAPHERPKREEIVEFEFQFPEMAHIETPRVDLEPARQVLEKALLVGIGAGVLLARGVASAVQSAARAGQEAAEHPGPVTQALLSLVGRGPAKDTSVQARVRVPVLPIDGYEGLSEDEILQRLPTLSVDELQRVREYEARHQARQGLLDAIDRMGA